MGSQAGARWWKVDFHTHTPASVDYAKGPDQAEARRSTTPSDWLLAFMRAGIDAVVVTDHNSGDWIDRLKDALVQLQESGHPDFRALTLFPGVEITANGGAHILAVFDQGATTAHITALLGEVKYHGEHGSSDRAADASPLEVIKAIHGRQALTVLAHVDQMNSAFEAKGNSLAPLLDLSELYAMEVCVASWQPPPLYSDRHLAWSRVLGSDSHHLAGQPGDRFPGYHFTWVKMETPSHEGLRLALLDGDELSIRRSDLAPTEQNAYAHLVLEEIEIKEAKYCGRSIPLRAPFSPWLTTVIGGRGTGKSTLVEMLRIALRREDDLPESLKPEFATFNATSALRDDRGALTDATEVRVVIRKDGIRYRVQWATSGSLRPIEEWRDGTWMPAVGNVDRRFPVRIFSQGQIFAMARDPRALLKIIDDSPEVDVASWISAWQLEEARYLSLRAKARELDKQLAEEASLQGGLADVVVKLAVFEQAEHAQILRAYQRAQQQRRAVDDWGESVAQQETELRRTAEALQPQDVDLSMFDAAVRDDRVMLDALHASRAEVLDLARRVNDLADEARERHARWARDVAQSAWTTGVAEIGERYRGLVTELEAQGIAAPGAYGELVQRRRLLEDRLRTLDDLRRTSAAVQEDAKVSLTRLATLRRELTTRRDQFLTTVLHGNRHVGMTVDPFGRNAASAERRFRELLGKPDGQFAADILSDDQGCLAELFRDLPADRDERAAMVATRLDGLKQKMQGAATGKDTDLGSWFTKHLQKMNAEAVDRLMLWWPADELAVSYSQRGDGHHFRSIEQGSPGQKTAAILAFLLAHGEEPIILDQPEDDLDNELIYKLIVAQLRSNKQRRQVIVVTHNPNIVVNGDAELILVMDFRAGQCVLTHAGSLQTDAIRNEVCNVMEGGPEALRKRYRRIVGGA